MSIHFWLYLLIKFTILNVCFTPPTPKYIKHKRFNKTQILIYKFNRDLLSKIFLSIVYTTIYLMTTTSVINNNFHNN